MSVGQKSAWQRQLTRSWWRGYERERRTNVRERKLFGSKEKRCTDGGRSSSGYVTRRHGRDVRRTDVLVGRPCINERLRQPC